jgi:hypothetical protein
MNRDLRVSIVNDRVQSKIEKHWTGINNDVATINNNKVRILWTNNNKSGAELDADGLL